MSDSVSTGKLLTALATIAVVLASACGTASNGNQPKAGGSVTIRLTADWDTLDPALTKSTLGYQMAFMAYDRVVALDKDGKVVPELAKSWTQTADTVKLSLRNDITCSDGSKLTATGVAESLKRLGAPDTKAPYAYRTFGTAGYTSVTGDDAAGTVTVQAAKPYSDMLIGLAMPWASIICPAGLKDPSQLQGKQFGSGPFTMTNLVRGDTYAFSARKEYRWGEAGATTQDPGFPGTVTYKVVSNDTTAANLLLTGGLDVATIAGPDLARVQANRSLKEIIGVPYGTTFLLVNELSGRVGADPQVRKAIFQAIDAASWGKAAVAEQAEVATSFITRVVPCFDPSTRDLVPAFDLSAAKSTLQAAGWTAGSDGKLSKGGQPLTLQLAASTSGTDSSAEYMLDALSKLGATVKLNNVDFVTYTGILFGTATPWDVATLPFGPPIPTPFAVNGFVSGATPAQKGTNAAYINNSTYNSESAAGLASTGAERCKHWANAQEALLKSYDIKPLAYTSLHHFGKNVQFRVIGGGAVIDVFSLKKS